LANVSAREYIKYFLFYLDREYEDLWSNFLFYMERHHYQVRLLKKNIWDSSVNIYFDEHITQIQLLYQQIDDTLFKWIQYLLVMTDGGWSRQKAEETMQEFEIIPMLHSTSKQLSILRQNLFHKLSRVNLYDKMNALLD